MAISFVGTATASVAADGNQTLPASMAENDVVVAGTASDGGLASGAGGINAGADAGTWTELYNPGGSSPGAEVFYKVMGATPDSVVDVHTASGVRDVAFLAQAFRGVDTTTPIDNSISTATGSGTPNAPSHTTSTDGAWRIIMGFLDDDDEAGSLGAPSGYSNFADSDTGNASTTAGATVVIASKLQATAGSEDPAVFTGSITGDAWAAVHFALRPAAGGAAANPHNPFGHPLKGPFGGPIG